MNLLSIILVFIFLGTLVVLGTALVGLGVWRLQRQVHGGTVTSTKALLVSLDVFLAASGLLLALYGVLGVYRIVWGT